MDLLDASSSQWKNLIDENKKYVIRYLRNIGVIEEHYSFTLEIDVIGLLVNNCIKAPKNIKATIHYLVQDYIERSLLSEKFQDHNNVDKDVINHIVD